MKMHKLGIAALFALGAAACSNKTDDANIAVDGTVNATEAANAEIEVLPPSEGNGVASSRAQSPSRQRHPSPISWALGNGAGRLHVDPRR